MLLFMITLCRSSACVAALPVSNCLCGRNGRLVGRAHGSDEGCGLLDRGSSAAWSIT
jgi:hypothetical protein